MRIASSFEPLERIQGALDAAVQALRIFHPGSVKAGYKSAHNPVTEADQVVNQVLHGALLRDGEGWLSEESEEDLQRLARHRVWVVDPLDGTREFIAGIPEWCVSVGLVEDGRAVAGGICNPVTGETFLGSLEKGMTYNGARVRASEKNKLAGAVVLASRSEVERGEWDAFRSAPFAIRATGSVAYKLALVAAGLADATWTFQPKHEWDIAAGVALVEAAGGFARSLGNSSLTFNNRSPLLPGLLAGGASLRDELSSLLDHHLRASSLQENAAYRRSARV